MMDPAPKPATTHNLYVDMDSLFDTVMGTVKHYDPDLVDSLLSAGYRARVCNKLDLLLPLFPTTEFMALYTNRDSVILRKSHVTNILSLLGVLTTIAHKVRPIEHPDGLTVNITLNTYPYKLSKSEVKEILSVIQSVTKCDNVVQVSASLDKLTPKAISKRWDKLFIYHFNDWVGYNLDRLSKTPIPSIDFIVPYNKLDRLDEVLDIEVVEKITKKAFARHLSLELLALDDFSLIEPGVPDE